MARVSSLDPFAGRAVKRFVTPLALLGIALTAASTAQGAWSPPQNLVALGYANVFTAQAVSAPDGTVAVAYERDGGLAAVVKPPGGTWGPAVMLVDHAPESGAHGPIWRVRIGPSGRAVVFWPIKHDIYAAVREPGADRFTTWGPVAHALPDEDYYLPISAIDAAVGANGRIYLAWGDGRGTTLSTTATTPPLEQATRIGPFPSVQNDDPNRGFTPPSVAVTPAGDGSGAVVLATTPVNDRDGTTLATLARRWSASGGEEPLVEVAKNTGKPYETGGPAVSSWADDTAVAVPGDRPAFFWQRALESRGPVENTITDQHLGLTLSAAGQIPAPTLFSSGRTDCKCGYEAAAVGADHRGVGAVGWFTIGNSNAQIRPVFQLSQRRSAGDAFGDPVSIPAFQAPTNGYSTAQPKLAPTSGGGVAVLYDDRTSFFRALVSPSGEVTEGPERMPTAEYTSAKPLFATGPGNGDVITGWFLDNSDSSQLQIAVRDVNPPALDATVESVTRKGDQVEVHLRATAADTWSGHRLTWDLGDGNTADQPSLTRAFTADRPVVIRVTATDDAGNASSKTLRTGAASSLQPGAPFADAAAVPVVAAGAEAPAGTETPAAVLSAVKLSPSRFRPRTTDRHPRGGSTLHLTLSAATRVQIAVERLVAGRRSKGRCVTKARTHKGARCTAVKLLWTSTRSLPAGPSQLAFTGRRGGRRMAAGRYRVTVRLAGDASQTGKPLRTSFQITG